MPQRIVIVQKKVTISVSKDRRLPRVAQYPAEQMVHDEEEDADKTSRTGPTSRELSTFRWARELTEFSQQSLEAHSPVTPIFQIRRLRLGS